MKLLSIVGARPQFIKVAALHRVLVKQPNVEHKILHTSQHYDHFLSGIFFEELDIPLPDFHLQLADRTKAASTERMTEGIVKILENEKPDIVIVYGDTNSTMAGALAAKKLNIKVAHVEAGLRSFNLAMPEEHNRINTDKISDLLFCPTTTAVNNLINEGFDNSKDKIILCGDLMLDAMNYYIERSSHNPTHENFILCTFHRQSLVTSPTELTEVIKALNEINNKVPIVMPAHPRFRNVIEGLGLIPEFKMIEPVGYLEMIGLLQNCKMIITDSGGLQKEAFFCKKICITVRNETEWKELVEAGVNFIAGTTYKKIIETFETAIKVKGNFEHEFYGKGNSAEMISEKLKEFYTNLTRKHGSTE